MSWRRQGLQQRGFGLLEAVVAMALMGTAGLMLFAWIQSSYDTANRLRATQDRAQARLEAQAWLMHLNPAKEPEGEVQLGRWTLQWRSSLVEPMRLENDYGGALSPRWALGLYEVRLEAKTAGDAVQWRQRIVGWQPLRGWAPAKPS
ncbi:MAG: type II secretion system protein [Inhella sp.]|uniref:type II secretion system protein n=1 Tax=Inhella sp. TaxID=1921806 RepID=UPI0022C23F63|nr:type II secretion system protein [Inhella sp.]MCZ8234459.1 type II secretion system protein [Inhella sp.]